MRFIYSPIAPARSIVRSSARLILPDGVLGKLGTNSILRGYLYGAIVRLTCSWICFGERVARQMSVAQHDECLDDHAADRVGAFDRRGFEHSRVTDQPAFHLERRDPIAAGIHHVVVAALEPEVAVFVAHEHVAGAVPRRRGRTSAVLLGLVPVFLHHARVRVAAEAEHALGADRYRLHVVVHQLDHRPWPGPAAASRLERHADVIETVYHAFGHADAVDRRDAELTLDGFQRVGRQRLARADRMRASARDRTAWPRSAAAVIMR